MPKITWDSLCLVYKEMVSYIGDVMYAFNGKIN